MADKLSPAQSTTSSAVPSRASTPSNAEKAPDDSSKLKTFLSILRKFIGVSDLAAIRFSLPAQLLEPTPNLEYWHYLDRPETFVSIGDAEDPFGRMVGALRFWFTKDLKYVKGKPCKPYNSTLGEFFRCRWDVQDIGPPPATPSAHPPSKAASNNVELPLRVSYITEQTSHHPPVSAWWAECPERDVFARGYDQLSAKFTGTSIRVTPGVHNLGIFVTLRKYDEEYRMTHPAAYLGGILRGALKVSVADHCTISCPKTKIKVILHYLEESWLGKAQNKVEGAIFTYDPDNDTIEDLKKVPEKDILGRVEGVWTDKVYYTVGSKPFNKNDDKHLLVDVNPLFPAPKICPPEEQQLPNESRKFWASVTNAILGKQYGDATNIKTELEEKQRAKAAERKAADRQWHPRFFTGDVTPAGRPELTEDGKKVLMGMHDGNFVLEPPKEYGAF